ncbi:phage major capsid protein [Salinisphaera sp. USBA-960]|nr:phage major capsid protein [Salifodinibacter halophilus]NNC27267.1 phage major capsid protein [Salifodinibacter halophilus]
MLQSKTIEKRQSEIREELSTLAGNDQLTNEQRQRLDTLDGEYKDNERRYRAALVSEDEQRQNAGAELETREGRQWSDLLAGYEVRQAALNLDEGRPLDGKTAEVVTELRNQGGYRGVPVPFAAFEQRAGETTSSHVPDPVDTRPLIDRLFPQSVASSMGAQMVNISSGSVEYPVSTSSVSTGWAGSEGAEVAGPTEFTTVDRPLSPDSTLGVQMSITRKAMKQSAGIEDAIRRDMQGAIQAEMDKVIFQGSGKSGQPSGVMAKASDYGIASTAVDSEATYGAFRKAVTEFMLSNAATGPNSVNALIRPEVWDAMDGVIFDSGSGVTEYDRLAAKLGRVTQSHNALADPSGSPKASSALLTTNAGGQSPIFVATWGAIDMIRDPYSDAASGGLRLTGLVTLDVSISRAEQLRILSGLQ